MRREKCMIGCVTVVAALVGGSIGAAFFGSKPVYSATPASTPGGVAASKVFEIRPNGDQVTYGYLLMDGTTRKAILVTLHTDNNGGDFREIGEPRSVSYPR